MATVDILIKSRDQASPELKQVATNVRAIAPAAATGASGIDRMRAALGSVDARRVAADLGGLRSQVGQIAPAAHQAAGGAGTLKSALSGIGSLRGDFLNVKDAVLGLASGFGVAALASKAFSEGIARAKAGFDLRVEIEGTRKAIDAQLLGIRDTAVVYADAQKFADRYKITQADLNSTLQSSVGLLQSSNASTTDLLGTLGRLQVLAPDKPISEAARALRELQSGDTTTIKELFNLSATSANKLKTEIVAGGDAIQVVSQYLDSVNIGMSALDAKTTGAAGKMRDLAVASEQFNLALGKIAASPVGLKILGIATDAATGAARLAGVVGGDADDIQAALGSLDQSARESTQSAGNWLGVLFPLKSALDELPIAVNGVVRPIAQLSGIIPAVTAATQQQTVAVNAQAQARQQQAAAVAAAVAATQKSTEAVAKDAATSAIAAAKSEELKQAKERLTKQAQIAADHLLALGATGAAEAARLAASSSDVDQLTAALYRLAAGKAAAAAADAAAATNTTALADQRAGERSGGTFKTAADAEEDAARKRSQARRQQEIDDARRAQLAATGTTAQKLALAQQEVASTKAGTAERIRAETEVIQLQRQLADEQAAARAKAAAAGAKDAKAGAKDAAQEAKARFALLDTEQQLAELRRRLASGRLSETDRLETVKQIKDLEEKISDEREKQVKSALDARLAALDDRKQRRAEEKELATARRVLGAADTSAEQKAAARDVLERVDLERQERALDIATKTRAGGGVATIPGAPTLPAGAVAAATGGAGAVGAPSVPAFTPQQIAQIAPVVDVAVYLDSQQIAARVVTSLRGGLVQAASAGRAQAGA